MPKKKKDDNKGLWILLGLLGFGIIMNKNKASAAGSGSGGTKISKYYTVSDVQKSDTAKEKGIKEQFEPLSPQILSNAKFYAQKILDPISDYIGKKYITDSWWRSKTLNGIQDELMLQGLVGGVSDSLHLSAFASDGMKRDNDLKKAIEAIIVKRLPVHKVIISGSKTDPSALHISAKPDNNAGKFLYKDSSGNYTEIDKNYLMQLLGITYQHS